MFSDFLTAFTEPKSVFKNNYVSKIFLQADVEGVLNAEGVLKLGVLVFACLTGVMNIPPLEAFSGCVGVANDFCSRFFVFLTGVTPW